MRWLSQINHKVTHAHIQGFGNPQQGMKADPLLASLNLSNVNGMEVGFLGQFLLTEPGLIPVFPNGLAKSLSL